MPDKNGIGDEEEEEGYQVDQMSVFVSVLNLYFQSKIMPLRTLIC